MKQLQTRSKMASRRGRPKKATINYHLKVLGCDIAYQSRRRKPILSEKYKSIYQRYENYEILYEATKAYRKRMTECHPDRGGDTKLAQDFGESYAWIKKRLRGWQR